MAYSKAGGSGTRITSGDQGPRGKDMRTGDNSSGGPVASPRANIPVKGTVNASTVKSSAAKRVTRPTSGSK